jgi:TldD protein
MNNWLQLGQEAVETLSGGDFSTLQSFIENRTRLKMTLEDGKIDQVETGRIGGLALTATRGQNTNFFCYSSLNEARDDKPDLPGLLDIQESNGSVSWNEPTDYSMPVDSELTASPTDSKCDRIIEADRVARDYDDRVSQVRVNYSEKTRTIHVIDQDGWIRTEPQQFVNFRVVVIARDDGRRERGHGRIAGYRGEKELFEDRGPEEVASDAAEQAVTALEAEPVDAGPRTVVIGPGFGGTIFHEACGHGFEADHIFEDVSQYAGKMGDKVASEKVTFVDDGSLNNHYGSFCIDDEGTRSGRNVLIKDGIMQGMMSDRKYADLLGVEPSGNGRRQSFNYPVLPRMTNTFIESGTADPESIIEDTEDGIYAAHIGGGQVDPASGDFIFSITEGYQIEDGSITQPIRDAALVGNGPEVLNRIDAVGDDLELRPGVCGKGQWVPVTVGQPTLRVQELTVGGQN